MLEAFSPIQNQLPLKAAAILLVMIVCLFFLANTATTWLGYLLEPTSGYQTAMQTRTASTAKTSGPSRAAGSPPDTQVVISRNIFGGNPQAQAEEEAQDDVALERIPLAKNLQNYALVGTIVNDTGENFAIIKDKGKNEQQLLQKGDSLESASIIRILRNNVIIQRDEQEQMLSIDYSARNLMQSNVGPGEQAEQEEGSDTVFVDIDKEFIQSSLSNLQSFMQQAQIVPYMQEGRPAGYRLRNIQQGSAFDKLGLQNNDIILSLNGNRLESPEQLLDFREELTTSDRASLQILRNGNPVDVEYSLN